MACGGCLKKAKARAEVNETRVYQDHQRNVLERFMKSRKGLKRKDTGKEV